MLPRTPTLLLLPLSLLLPLLLVLVQSCLHLAHRRVALYQILPTVDWEGSTVRPDAGARLLQLQSGRERVESMRNPCPLYRCTMQLR